MLPYLIKLTIIWALLLFLYELQFKKTSHFKANRIYLFVAILSGILIPLIPLQFLGSGFSDNMDIINKDIQKIGTIANANATTPQQTTRSWEISEIVGYIYLSGVVIACFLAFREIILILRKAIYGHYITVMGHKIFSNSKMHAPFSFMGWIFISHPEQYSDGELTFILKHEEAHNRRYHWLDMILIQIVFIIFWFHPLVWRFRYLLKMNHEFEADQIAASSNPFAYGHFLLEQTLLQGTPAIAHSFHFSPIKNRINMLTQQRKSSIWKYALTLPILLGCTILFAKSLSKNERIRVGNVTTFNGHKYYWDTPQIDSIQITDPETGATRWMIAGEASKIYKMDNDSVYAFDETSQNFQFPKFRNELQETSVYLTDKFKQKVENPIDSISQIGINNVVLDKSGKIMYYELTYMGRNFTSKHHSSNKVLDPIIDEIILNCPVVETKSLSGVSVPTYLPTLGNIVLNNLSGNARKIK